MFEVRRVLGSISLLLGFLHRFQSINTSPNLSLLNQHFFGDLIYLSEFSILNKNCSRHVLRGSKLKLIYFYNVVDPSRRKCILKVGDENSLSSFQFQ